MFIVYKLTKFFVKLFVKVVLLPVKLVARLIGSDAAAGTAGGFADSLGAGDDDPDSGETGVQQTREPDSRSSASSQEQSVAGTLSWVGSFLADRPVLFLPPLALGLVRAVLVGPTTTPGEPGPTVLFGSLLVMVGGLWVGGIVALATGDSFQGRRRDLAELAGAATSGLLSAFGVAVVVVLAASTVGAVLAGFGAVVLGPLAVVMALPVLYLVLRVALAVPAVFVGGRGFAGALRESWSLSSGNVLTLAGLGLVTGLTAALGVVPTVGTVVSTTVGTPLWMASLAHVYLGTGGGTPGGTVRSSPTSGRDDRNAGRGRSSGGESAAWNQPDADASERQPASGTSTESSSVADSSKTAGTTAADANANHAEDAVAGTPNEESGTGRDSASAATGSALAKDSTGAADEAPATGGEADADSEGAVESGTAAEGVSDRPAVDEQVHEPTEAAEDTTEDETGDDPKASLPEDDAERVALVSASVESGDATPEHIDALVDALDVDDPAVRRDAAEALGDLAVAEPTVADEAVAALRDSRLDPDVDVSEAASSALDRAREET
jgi:hypothetical protein